MFTVGAEIFLVAVGIIAVDGVGSIVFSEGCDG